jgi:hypothetical protein
MNRNSIKSTKTIENKTSRKNEVSDILHKLPDTHNESYEVSWNDLCNESSNELSNESCDKSWNELYNEPCNESCDESCDSNNSLKINEYDLNFLNGLHSLHCIKKAYNEIMNPRPDLYEYSQIPDIIPYSEASKFITSNCHFGQRKLLLTEIEYYNMLDRNKHYLIVYPGSASCEHLPVILQMFPNLKFLLIDPNYHSMDINYSFKYIYQNIPMISPYNLKMYKSQIRRTNNGFNSNRRNEHLRQSAELLLNVEFVNDEYTYNVLDLDNNYDRMDEIMQNFMNDSVNLVSDMYDDSSNRVFIIQDYMSIELADRIKKSFEYFKTNDENDIDLCFLSDIRTSLFREGNPTDLDIIWNYALQIIFIKTLQPLYSMTKFRPPWFNQSDTEGITILNLFKLYNENENEDEELSDMTDIFRMIKTDFDFVKKNYGIDIFDGYLDRKTYYFENDFIYTQAWAPSTSSETRLFVSKKNIDKFVVYDATEWDNKFYFMRFARSFSYFDTFYKVLKDVENNDYDGCYDCYRELLILGNYLLNQKRNKKSKFNGVLDIKRIKETIKNDVSKLQELYDLINKYVYYDLKPNFKCMYHHSIIKKSEYIIANFYSDDIENPFIYGVKIDEASGNDDDVTKNDIVYKYEYEIADKKNEFMSQFMIDTTKNNLYFVKR